VGFPIRKSADQSFLAAPHGLSQRSTSFIASQRQGIHRMPLRHLIALIIDARQARWVCVRTPARAIGTRRAAARRIPKVATDRTIIDLRKTSLLRDRSDGSAVKRSRQALAPSTPHVAVRRRCGRPCGRPLHKCGVRVLSHDALRRRPKKLGAISSSRCQTPRARPEAATRIVLLFWTRAPVAFDVASAQGDQARRSNARVRAHECAGHWCLVEPDGIEPTTSCLQSRRSPS
jgi:hypothetical protein